MRGFEEQLWCGRWKRRFCDGDMVRYGAVASSSASLVSYYIPVCSCLLVPTCSIRGFRHSASLKIIVCSILLEDLK